MTDHVLCFEIRSYWHAGTGRGGGALLDAKVHRDGQGLPCLPGRTVKGLVRDAMNRTESWGHVPGGITEALFGSVGAEAGQMRLETESGALGFSDARLPDKVASWLVGQQEPAYREALFRPLYATAIDPKTGTAEPKSLRGLEVTVPLTLESHVSVLKPDRLDLIDWVAALDRSLPLVRAVGAQRSRGLGRAWVTLENRPCNRISMSSYWRM